MIFHASSEQMSGKGVVKMTALIVERNLLERITVHFKRSYVFIIVVVGT